MMALSAPSQPIKLCKSAPHVQKSHGDRAEVDAARARLLESPYRGLRSVTLDASGNQLILTGRVRTFFLKQMAQHLLGEYGKSWEIRNELQVA